MAVFLWSKEMWLYIKWFLLGLLSVPMAVFAKAICWILPFFVEEETKRLPVSLDWFMTPDTDADGDLAHWKRHPGTDWWSTYKRRTAWFWRNSAYGFDRQVLGVEVYGADTMTAVGVIDAGRRPFKPGSCMRKLYSEDGKFKAWFWYFCVAWPFGLFKSKCIRGSFGWKLWCKEEDGHGIAQWTGMCNPFFSRE